MYQQMIWVNLLNTITDDTSYKISAIFPSCQIDRVKIIEDVQREAEN